MASVRINQTHDCRGRHHEVGDKSAPFTVRCYSMNGDSCTRHCAAEDEAAYWQQRWRNSGGRVVFVSDNRDAGN